MDKTRIRRILVFHFNGLGNALLSLPILKSLKKIFPEATLNVMAGKGGASLLFSSLPYIDKVIIWEVGSKGKQINNFLKLLWPKGRIDLAFASAQVEDRKSPFISLLSMAPYRVGASNFKGGKIYNVSTFVPKDLHIGKRDWELIKLIDPSINPSLPSLSIPEHFIKKVQQIIPLKKKGEIWVLFHFHSPWLKFKNWEEEKVVKLGRILSKEGIKVFFAGSLEERKLYSFLSSQIPGSIDLSGRLNHPFLLGAFIKFCNLFVGIDSGPAHLAGILGVPMVLLFGPTPPSLYAPLVGELKIVRKKLPCSPCYPKIKSCPTPLCMKKIGVEEVWEKIKELLK
ncbi:glycosyltransferase family 9 protein [Candidatus Calescamantes bacterium]|nr:glycosyltransferase family 9 protein [Candidatus Calescamantes bacterium]